MDKPRSIAVLVVLALSVGEATTASPAWAEDEQEAQDGDEKLSFFETTTITATGIEISTFNVPAPVIVVSAERMEEILPDNAADLLRNEPGVDVNGTGPNHVGSSGSTPSSTCFRSPQTMRFAGSPLSISGPSSRVSRSLRPITGWRQAWV